ncbi:MAG: response regulator, partial [Methanomicrobiales archaeon]|nr:response regulator [Methanomicrobiales archaeon]
MFRVLAIDDDRVFLELTRTWLTRFGDMQVEATTSPVQGLDMITKIRYDAIVSDYEMAEMDG